MLCFLRFIYIFIWSQKLNNLVYRTCLFNFRNSNQKHSAFQSKNFDIHICVWSFGCFTMHMGTFLKEEYQSNNGSWCSLLVLTTLFFPNLVKCWTIISNAITWFHWNIKSTKDLLYILSSAEGWSCESIWALRELRHKTKRNNIFSACQCSSNPTRS